MVGELGPNDEGKIVKVFKAEGLPCVIRRPRHQYFLCGYIGVPKGHALYGEHYSDIPDCIPAHGGWTFSGAKMDGLEEHECWVIGFDCNHIGDALDSMRPAGPYNPSIRDEAFVEGVLREAASALVNY